MLTGYDYCPVKPWLGVRLSNVPKSWLRDCLYNGPLRTFRPNLVAYARSKFSPDELLIIDNEIAEAMQAAEIRYAARELILPPRIPHTAPERVVKQTKQDLTPLVEDHRALEL